MATQDAHPRFLMLVPVSFVGCVTVSIVDVISMVTVRDSLMPTTVAMGVLVVRVLRMRQVALVVMIAMGAMGVAIVYVVHMALVLDSRMAATGSVLVGVIFMHVVLSRTHGFSLRSLWPQNEDRSEVWSNDAAISRS
jgi:hypothetical protein